MMTEETERPPSAGTIAADGGLVPGTCNTLGEFVRTVEDGQFDADCYGAICELSQKLNAAAWAQGGKAKGKVTIVFDFAQEGGVTEVRSTYKVTAPEEKRAKSVLWSIDGGRLTRTNPRQTQLFGIRDVSGGGAAIRTL